MARVVVTDESGTPTWTERVTPEDFETEHFRRCLCERLHWAVADATEAPGSVTALATPTIRSARNHLNGRASRVALAA
jgi:hypothetical protein